MASAAARIFLGLIASVPFFGQLLPDAEFALDARLTGHSRDRSVRVYFVANSDGLTLVSIARSGVSLVSADLDGRILHSRADLASVHGQIYEALPRADGSVWLVSGGPYRFFDGGGSEPQHNDLDLYSRAGKHLESFRLLALVAGAESPIAAANDQLVLRSADSPGFHPRTQFFHFGSPVDGGFRERTRVRLTTPVLGAIATMTDKGDLLLIDKKSGNMVVIDPQAKTGSMVRLAKPVPVGAAAAAGDCVYLLSENAVLKTDRGGHELATYHFQFGQGFEPVSLGVTAHSLYLVDRTSRVERFPVH